MTFSTKWLNRWCDHRVVGRFSITLSLVEWHWPEEPNRGWRYRPASHKWFSFAYGEDVVRSHFGGFEHYYFTPSVSVTFLCFHVGGHGYWTRRGNPQKHGGKSIDTRKGYGIILHS